MARRMTLVEFIDRSRELHGDLDTYEKTEYVNSQTKVTITCKIHGDYEIKPGNHLVKKQRCQKCWSENVKKQNKIPNEDMNDMVNGYTDGQFMLITSHPCILSDPIQVKCKTHDTIHDTTLQYLKQGRNPCAECSKIKHRQAIDKDTVTWENFVEIHNHRGYTYIEPTDFLLSKSILTLKCQNPEHPPFNQTARDFHSGKGCKKCAWEKLRKDRAHSLEHIINEAKLHYDHFDYSKSRYVNGGRKIKIRCTKHDVWFEQIPYNHMRGINGCPKCKSGTSSGETRLASYIEDELGCMIIHRQRIGGIEYDITLPEHKLVIEYCGNYWHSELSGKDRKYHLNKLTHARDNGYRLLTIYEDEWVKKESIVKARIRNMVGMSERGFGARKLNIVNIDYAAARDFINLHHIQGANKQMSVRYGAYHGDELVAVMAFNTGRKSLGSGSNVWELVRFVTDGRNHPGVAGRLLKQFCMDYPNEVLVSFADRRWSEGNLYDTLGFEKIAYSPPSYWYVKNSNYLDRKHRFGFRKAWVVEKFNADPNKTEWEIMQDNGYDRIWDCGAIKYTKHT